MAGRRQGYAQERGRRGGRQGDRGGPGRGGRVASAVSVLGELLITFGVLLGLFVAYSLWWTNVLADRQADSLAHRLRDQWTHRPATGDTAPRHPRSFAVGDPVGFLHVPALGADSTVLIRMGTGTEILNQGVAGVYRRPYAAAMPWERTGNFALAAHRDGHGAKFHNLDRLHKGDPVVVETSDTWYVYRVDAVLPQTSKEDTGVIAPVPKESGFTRPGRYITLTTCTPVYTSRYRMAVWGSLVRTVPVDARRTPPAELR
ncbi:class E sortase [Streptacidiphilus sp. ASG 303]|uniref:class E sortase n=1 Tax=Streptacidiphilus sp. ASG 303 TaxID=2896847 RepID=UPI0035B0BDDC